MKNIILGATAFFLFLKCYSQGITPTVINSAGGNFKSGYYQFEWSIGELALVGQMNSSNNSLIVTNGFLQPYTNQPGSSNPGNFFSIDEIKVFPNPASSYIEINFFTKQKGRISLDFYDITGKKVYQGNLLSHGVDLIERISLKHFAIGTYMLNIHLAADEGYVSKKGAYKIVKTD